MTNMAENAKELFLQGFSCSEAVLHSALSNKLLPDNIDVEQLNKIASVFSGGMSSGCLCGAIAGAQIIIGLVYGRKNSDGSSAPVKTKAKDFIDKFKSVRKATCCKALTAGSTSANKRENCSKIVYDAANLLEQMLVKSLKEDNILAR